MRGADFPVNALDTGQQDMAVCISTGKLFCYVCFFVFCLLMVKHNLSTGRCPQNTKKKLTGFAFRQFELIKMEKKILECERVDLLSFIAWKTLNLHSYLKSS